MKSLIITQPDDWHLHLRDGDYLSRTVHDTARQFARAIIMPNLTPPITSIHAAENYRQRILNALPDNTSFTPLMTLYLTDAISPKLIQQAANHPHIHACKLYPAGATTNSANGVTDLQKIYPVLEMLQKTQLPLCIHGEVTDATVDVFDRETVFIDQVLIPLLRDFPQLKIILEHITTQDAVQFIESAPSHVGATITAHHLLYHRNAIFKNGINPHYYCLPILKRVVHQQALINAVISGNPKFFLGTDSAPHTIKQKETSCGCAGIYTAHAAIELYAEVFEHANALDKLEGFASFHGADFYGLPRNQGKLQLNKITWQVSNQLSFGQQQLKPLRAGEQIKFRSAIVA